ncbi:F-box protein At5g18160-like isoform X2 [Malania oleifera]|uniref:F-box protein At5g18160-like isoform X2 n=1 Tax=Malania oleifera TaxID=397392 RepID=UPI0025AE16EA|nr:F-box protein At5g18160-like isoform X2 [Malania oleifera]
MIMAQFLDEDWVIAGDDYCNLVDEDDLSHKDDCGSEENFTQSSDLDFDDDVDLPGFQSVAVQWVPENEDIFFEKIKRREDMTIEDIVREHSLPFLPAKSLVRFRSVCKNWDEWIRNPFLAHKQTNCFRNFSGLFRQSTDGFCSFISLNRAAYDVASPDLTFLPESVYIRSSCSGLLCCQGRSGDHTYYICNPVNMEWIALPQPNLYHGSEPAVVLAFDPSTLNFAADYDLVCAIPPIDSPIHCFEIYSSRTGSWRVSDTVCCEEDVLNLNSCGFYMKGVAYWETLSTGKVLAFDMKHEHYGVLELPDGVGTLAEMRGELCYIQAYPNAQYSCVVDIYGVADLGLNQRIVLPNAVRETYEHCRVLPCINSNILVILAGGKTIAYYVKDHKVVQLRSYGDLRATYWPYVNSLVHITSGPET